MKRILITGKNSYIGIKLYEWLNAFPGQYEIQLVSLRDDQWKEINFSRYDVVVHVAGIAHASADLKMEELYYKVNRDLAIEVAKKSRREGIRQFIFLSSIIVYGDSSDEVKVIDHNTTPIPSNFYGKSKLQAEEGIRQLESDHFKVVILRPPMIYGKGSKGNYPKLAKAARVLPFFPDIDNQRSMLHIDNLCEFIRLIVDHEERGLFFPQNCEYVRTSDMVRRIAKVHGKKMILTKIFNPVIKVMGRKIGLINKVFGNLVYDQKLSVYDKADYRIRDLQQSIELTEKG